MVATRRDGQKGSSKPECSIDGCAINPPQKRVKLSSVLTQSDYKGVKDSQRGQLGNSAALVRSFRGVQLENKQVCKVHGDFMSRLGQARCLPITLYSTDSWAVYLAGQGRDAKSKQLFSCSETSDLFPDVLLVGIATGSEGTRSDPTFRWGRYGESLAIPHLKKKKIRLVEKQ